MTNKAVLEAQAEILKTAREKLKSYLEGSGLNMTGVTEVNKSLISICEQERLVAELQMARGYVEE